MTDPPVLRLLPCADGRPACRTPDCGLRSLESLPVCSQCARVYACALLLCQRLMLRDLQRHLNDGGTVDALLASRRGRPRGPWPHGLDRLDGRELAALEALVAELRAWNEADR